MHVWLMLISDFGWPWMAIRHSAVQIVHLLELTTEIWWKLDPYCLQEKCSHLAIKPWLHGCISLYVCRNQHYVRWPCHTPRCHGWLGSIALGHRTYDQEVVSMTPNWLLCGWVADLWSRGCEYDSQLVTMWMSYYLWTGKPLQCITNLLLLGQLSFSSLICHGM